MADDIEKKCAFFADLINEREFFHFDLLVDTFDWNVYRVDKMLRMLKQSHPYIAHLLLIKCYSETKELPVRLDEGLHEDLLLAFAKLEPNN